jgi:apolipoprotein N-acyltransferase
VLRATNNGLTAIVAPTGAIVSQAPQFEPIVLDGTFSGMSGITPYGVTGDVPVLLALAIGIVISLYFRRRRG